jgi:hypothetical protein
VIADSMQVARHEQYSGCKNAEPLENAQYLSEKLGFGACSPKISLLPAAASPQPAKGGKFAMGNAPRTPLFKPILNLIRFDVAPVCW